MKSETKASFSRYNNCVQATPDCASLFIFAQVSGAPDVENVRRRGAIGIGMRHIEKRFFQAMAVKANVAHAVQTPHNRG